MASLRKKNGIYFVDYRVNGKRRRKNVGKSKKIAELALKDIELKLAKNEIGFAPKDQKLETLFQEYLTYSKTNHAPSSYKRYRAIIDNFKSFLSKYPHLTKISQLNVKIFENYKTFRKKLGKANKTINMEIDTIRSMFNLAIKWGYAKDNPVTGITMLKEDNHKKPRFLSEDEIKLLLDNCGAELYSIFFTFIYSGMRKSELENLEWNDIDFIRRKIKIRVKDSWRPKTTEREIPINDSLFSLLKKHKTKNKKGGYVFRYNGEKIPENLLRKKLMQITKRIGIEDVTKIHSLRHTFASHLIMKGVDLPTVSKLLGHSDIQTTMIYAHLADKHVEQAVEKLLF